MGVRPAGARGAARIGARVGPVHPPSPPGDQDETGGSLSGQVDHRDSAAGRGGRGRWCDRSPGVNVQAAQFQRNGL